MLALTFSTGVVDAIGYLGLDRVFTGNMTGNVVILGMGLAGADGLPVVGPLLALLGFMAGAALGGRTLKTAGPGWSRRTTWLLGLVATAMVAGGVVLLLAEEDLSRPAEVTMTTILGAVMGIQAATARFIAVKDVTTVVVTSTITGLAADSALGAGKGDHSARRVAAVILILAGAAAGAALLRWHLGAGLLLAGLVSVLVTVLGAVHAVHHRGAGVV
jgi:uncharacterized membrane protein YoaK (UPF0700 family)